MAPLRLTKVIFVLLFIMRSLSGMGASGFICKEVLVQSKSISASEKASLCFLKDDTYFLSKNCSQLNCQFIERLRKIKITANDRERPGATTCHALKGMVEEVGLPGSTLKIQRCLFPKEGTSISLNLLESWDGKKFSGPSKPLKM